VRASTFVLVFGGAHFTKGSLLCGARKEEKTSAKRRRTKNIAVTNKSPFEQESKRPIGQHGATGRPPLMKK